MEGFVKLYRKSLESVIFQNANLWQVWSYCLMRANHKHTEVLWNNKEIVIKAGSFITGRFEGSKDCNMNPNTFYKQLKTLENLNCIKIESKNKFSIISIINWKKYQIDNNKNIDYSIENEGFNEGSNNFHNTKITTIEHQNNTNHNNKNIDYNLINSRVNKGDSNFHNNKITKKEHQNNTDNNDKNNKLIELSSFLIEQINNESSLYAIIGKYRRDLGEVRLREILADLIKREKSFNNENKLAGYLNTCQRNNNNGNGKHIYDSLPEMKPDTPYYMDG